MIRTANNSTIVKMKDSQAKKFGGPGIRTFKSAIVQSVARARLGSTLKSHLDLGYTRVEVNRTRTLLPICQPSQLGGADNSFHE